jgi:uncharacterized Zn finger protein (UPF0148 family)
MAELTSFCVRQGKWQGCGSRRRERRFEGDSFFDTIDAWPAGLCQFGNRLQCGREEDHVRKVKQPTMRHCYECGCPIGNGHRGVLLCRACENELKYWLRGHENERERNGRRHVRRADDSELLRGIAPHDRRLQKTRRQPPRTGEYLPTDEETLEIGDLNSVRTSLEI